MDPGRMGAGVDTDAATRARALELVRALSPAERLARALALTALVRDLAWEGARARADDRGAAGVRDRFLRQLHGPAFDPRPLDR